MSEIVRYSSKKSKKTIQDLKKESSTFILEEREREKNLKEDLLKRERSKKSVLERIQSQAKLLENTTYVEFVNPKMVKKELNRLSRLEDQEEVSKESGPSKGGRPRIDRSLKAKKVPVSIKAHLFHEIEKRKNEASKPRSEVLCNLVEKGLKFERLRRSQAETLKRYLKEFIKISAGIKVKNSSPLWRSSEISLDDNKIVLAKLYKKSIEIRNYLNSAGIDPVSFSDIEPFFNTKELNYLEFASVPEKMANIVANQSQLEEENSGQSITNN